MATDVSYAETAKVIRNLMLANDALVAGERTARNLEGGA